MFRNILTSTIIFVCIFGSILLSSNIAQAEWATVQIEVTEKIPWAWCVDDDDGKEWIYDCNIGSWFSSVTIIIGNIIKYFTYITALAAVLFIVINWILYSMSGIDAGMKDSAKKRIIQTLLGLVVLLLAGTILNAIAPWIYTA